MAKDKKNYRKPYSAYEAAQDNVKFDQVDASRIMNEISGMQNNVNDMEFGSDLSHKVFEKIDADDLKSDSDTDKRSSKTHNPS